MIPKPRVNLTRFHGVFAPNSQYRVQVTPAKRGKGAKSASSSNSHFHNKSEAERHQSMTWMQRLKRVFNIDIKVCEHCGGKVKVIACIDDPLVIAHILKHIKQKTTRNNTNKHHVIPQERAPPLKPDIFDPSQSRLFD